MHLSYAYPIPVDYERTSLFRGIFYRRNFETQSRGKSSVQSGRLSRFEIAKSSRKLYEHFLSFFLCRAVGEGFMYDRPSRISDGVISLPFFPFLFYSPCNLVLLVSEHTRRVYSFRFDRTFFKRTRTNFARENARNVPSSSVRSSGQRADRGDFYDVAHAPLTFVSGNRQVFQAPPIFPPVTAFEGCATNTENGI